VCFLSVSYSILLSSSKAESTYTNQLPVNTISGGHCQNQVIPATIPVGHGVSYLPSMTGLGLEARTNSTDQMPECHNDGGASGDDDEVSLTVCLHPHFLLTVCQFQPSPAARKHYLPPIVHPRPVRRVHLDSGPAQSQPSLPSFLSESRVPSSSQAVATQPLFKPDSPSAECSSRDNRSPTPPPILLRPTLDDRLPESSIRQWQDSILVKPEVIQAKTPHMKGPKAANLATFLISAVYALARQEPVPKADNKSGVTANHINTLYSLFKPFPSFFV
jgi:hypothetical protein